MDGITIKRLSRDTNVPVSQLIVSLENIGVKVAGEDDIVTGKQQLELLKQGDLKMVEQKSVPKDNLTFKDLENAQGLLQLDAMLTKLMTSQQIQHVIKDEKLDELVNIIAALVDIEDAESALYASSMLGRLAAVARSREPQVLARVPELIDGDELYLIREALPSLDVFSKEAWKGSDKDDIGKRRNYAAMSLRQVNEDWIPEYCLREAVNIDTAENARRELLGIALSRFDSIADWMRAINEQSVLFRSIEKAETKVIRSRRIFSAMLENTNNWKGELGSEPGQALSDCLTGFIRGKFDDVEPDKLFDAVDSVLAILVRMIEMRFSHALYASIYASLIKAKAVLGPGLWDRFLDNSVVLPEVRLALLESSLVLARQDKYDNDMLNVLRAAYGTKSLMTNAIKKHFANTRDLDTRVSQWWCKGGGVSGQEQATQKVRNSEDEKIGELLLKVEVSREVMEKLGRAVLPILEPMNPVLAKTVEQAESDYKDMAQIIRGLSRMRQLQPAGLLSERMDYNQRLHDMVGGHRSGIRRIRVVRDGVEKKFAGTTKMLVKPWVKPED